MAAITKSKRRLMGDINVVPYIDVMLVLLIIFMITAPLLTQGIKVDLPKANAEAIASQANQPPLVLSCSPAQHPTPLPHPFFQHHLCCCTPSQQL